jgi:hypothetical protein
MAINYYSLNIITNDLSDNVFSGVFGIDIGSSQVIKFFNNTNTNENILNTHLLNSNGADWLFINNKFSQNGTIISSIPLLNISSAQNFKLYTVSNVNLIDYFDGSQWITITNTFVFVIQFITTTQPVQQRLTIDKFCALQQRRGLTRIGGCVPALPLSKKNIYINNNNSNSNNTRNSGGFTCSDLRNKMKYAEYVRIYGGTQKSTSSTKKICLIAGPAFTY